MDRGLIMCLCLLIGGLLSFTHAQEPLSTDTSRTEGRIKLQQIEDRTLSITDSISPIVDTPKVVLTDSIIVINKPAFKPNSTKAVLYSAMFPGLGQIYNRKYWKLPIVYGGVLGLTYAITWNGNMYGDYNQAYRDLVTGSGTSYTSYLPYGRQPEDWDGGREGFQSALKRKKDFFRRNRDLAIIVAVGVYALCMIDAYVDAQLYDFDMSPDLSMRVVPVIMTPTSYSKMAIGLQCNIIF